MNHKLVEYSGSSFLSHASGILTGLILLCLALALSACNSTDVSPTHTQTATLTTVPTRFLTPHPSATSVPTKSPTVSFTASATPEPTWPPQPTRTPLIPTPAGEKTYRLIPWTLEKAEQFIQYFREYPSNLLQEPTYWVIHAYRYGGLAEMESTYRFPNTDQAKTWQQDAAYNLYLSVNWDINHLYTSWITSALNRHETSLEDLPTWFFTVEPRLSLEVIPVKPPPGYQKSAVVHVHSNAYSDFEAGLAFWLLQKGDVFWGYSLPNQDSDAYHEMASKVSFQDITGDHFPEVMIQHDSTHMPDIHIGTLTIYRLDQIPPREITLDIPFPSPSIAEWSVDNSQPIPTITFTVTRCKTFKVDWQYQWQMDQLRFIRVVPPPLEVMVQNPECTRTLVDSLSSEKFWGNQASLETYKQLLDHPFIARVDFGQGYTLYTDKDRFSLALYLSDHGDEAGANEQIEKIRDGTDPSLAEWRNNVVAYFPARRDPQALLQFCLTSKKCEDFLNIPDRIALVPPGRFSEIDTLLPKMGLDFSLSGSYDFDQDGQAEKWLLFRNGCGSSFRVLAKYEDGTKGRKAVRLCLSDQIQTGEKVNILPLSPSGGLPEYQVWITGQEQAAEKFLYYPLDQKDPTLDVRQAEQMIDVLQNQFLLRQISPAEAEKQIVRIQNLPIQPEYRLPEIQAHLYYLLGLAQELKGENSQAAQTYLELWQSYPNSPYAIMAFAKLEPVP